MFCTKCGSPVTGSFCRNCGAPAAASVPPSQPEPPVPPRPPAGMAAPAPPMQYAEWSTRVGGYLIDMLFVGAVTVLLFIVAAMVFGSAAGLSAGISPDIAHAFGGLGCCLVFSIFPLASLIVGLYNKVYLVSSRGASVGQGVVHIRVVDAQGRLLSQGVALVRLLAQIGIGLVPFGVFIDLLWPLWDPQRQTLHDKAVGCFVIPYRGV
ncbi:MAG TPA: RDD family protein [Bryobacteraceae bacterium]|nr:RDD family protein [Bryobacteraceae bacterium]